VEWDDGFALARPSNTTPVLNFLKRRALRLSSYKRPYFTYLKNRLGGQSKSIAFFRTPTTYLEADRSGKGQAHT
ncbi:hypothetical protein, partial [uncultured Parasutterella sp.]|uniref:hypothetical protein n=1 Tax=uncultured Parasutterella sp. TaxID=1263098 RepID=UPI00272A1028